MAQTKGYTEYTRIVHVYDNGDKRMLSPLYGWVRYITAEDDDWPRRALLVTDPPPEKKPSHGGSSA